jgi:hypothetical protein
MNGGDVKVKIDTGGAQEQLADLNAPSTGNPPLSIPAVPEDNQFHSVSIPLASFTTSSGSTISDIVFQLSTGNPTETIYVDNVRFE